MAKKEVETHAATQELLALLVLGEGMSVAKAAADPRISISTATAYKWVQSEPYKRKLREIIAETTIEVQGAARKRIAAAFKLVDLALDSPVVTPTQLAAARTVLQYATLGANNPNESGNVFHIELNTTLNPNAAEEQSRRYEDLRRNAIETPFTVVE